MGSQKLPNLSGHEICKALYKDGFQMVSKTGSHVKLKKHTKEDVVLTVIVPDHDSIGKGLLRAIIKQSGNDRNSFLKLL